MTAPGDEPHITAHRLVAYTQAGIEDCMGCGKRGWSIDGVNVVKHENDADDETCSFMRTARERVATWLMGYDSIAATPEPPGTAVTTAASTWNAGPPVTLEDFIAMAQAIDDKHRRAHIRWAAQWRGRLDGATLNQVMRLWHRGELPHHCHLAAGPGALAAIRRRTALQARLPAFAVPVGAALRFLDSIDVVPDEALGDQWEFRHGPPPASDDDPRGEVIARGVRLA